MNFRQLFRFTFIVFSLYLMGDAFSSWDGFSYYASFSEFLPSIALASILWSIVSLLTAVFIWMLFMLLVWLCRLIGIDIRLEHLLLYACIFILFGGLGWKVKKVIWPYLQTTFQIKLIVFLCISFVSIFMVWLFRGKAKQWSDIVIQRITPLVWLFGLFVIISVPLVAYHAWIDGPDKTVSKKNPRYYATEKTRPNIVLVTFDALAARNMSAYGYHKETTPFISKWAKDAAVFTMAEAASNFTTPAAASLITGKRVWTHRTFHIAGTRPAKSSMESLPSVLKEYGYFNMALVVNPFASVSSLGISGSFDIAPAASEFSSSASLFGWKFGFIDNILYRAFGEKIRLHNWILRNDFILSKVINLFSRNIYQTTVPPDKVFDRFLDIIDNDIHTPFFVWIHVFPPHDPYLSPEPFQDKLNNTPELRSYKKQEKIIEKSYEYLFKYQPVPDDMKKEIELMRAYYDEFVGFVDKSYENFIGELSNRKLENTLIVLTADHGESFEHGYFTHGGPYLYEQVTNIPLIIKLPGQNAGTIVNDIVEQIDIPATILDLANIPVPSWMEGRSLLPLMRGEKLPGRPAFAMNFQENRSRGHQIKSGSIAVWEGDYKLIHYLEKGESLLFNLKRDPDEKDNLIDREHEIGQHLLDTLFNNLNAANE
jgi:arylsulfatase A-like enzyme